MANLNEKKCSNIVKILKSLGSIPRLKIVDALAEGKELKVGDLEKMVGLSQSALSQHLAILREVHIVKTRRSSQMIFYSLDDKQAEKVLKSFV